MSSLTTRRVIAGIAALAAALALAGPATAIIFSTKEIRGAVALERPSAWLPTQLPPKVRWTDVGGGCNIGPGAPPCLGHIAYTTKRTGGVKVFEMGIYAGHRQKAVLRALRAHDGRFGHVTRFRAGRFHGVRERQWAPQYHAGAVDTYVWQYRDNTYLLAHHLRNNLRVEYRGFVPKRVIRSLSPVAGSPPPASLVPPGSALVTVPDVIGLDPAAAGNALRAAGLDVRGVGQEPAPSPELVGKVIRTDPAPSAEVPAGSPAMVYVGT